MRGVGHISMRGGSGRRKPIARAVSRAASALRARVPLPPPLPSSSAARTFSEQSAPVKPAVQWHVPLTQRPWYEHSLAHVLSEQSLPRQPGAQ